jgi:hypothetical protein
MADVILPTIDKNRLLTGRPGCGKTTVRSTVSAQFSDRDAPAMSRSLRLDMTPEQRAMIEAEITEYIEGDAYEGARRACSEAHALPLYLDWTACLAIQPDGEVIWIDDESHEVQEVEDERVRNLALFQGSRRDPDLRCLVPPRTPDATDCPECHGSGKLPFRGDHAHLAKVIICSCGGLGWVPATPASSVGPTKGTSPTTGQSEHTMRRWAIGCASAAFLAVLTVVLLVGLHFLVECRDGKVKPHESLFVSRGYAPVADPAQGRRLPLGLLRVNNVGIAGCPP